MTDVEANTQTSNRETAGADAGRRNCGQTVVSESPLVALSTGGLEFRGAGQAKTRDISPEPTGRLELPTGGLRNRCSTN
jgi:hypothetical protein